MWNAYAYAFTKKNLKLPIHLYFLFYYNAAKIEIDKERKKIFGNKNVLKIWKYQNGKLKVMNIE